MKNKEVPILLAIGFVFGFMVAICTIDDLDQFTIPFTGKTFIRTPITNNIADIPQGG